MEGFNGDYREYKLDNGLHIILLDRQDRIINGYLAVDFGALNEERGEEGLVHFLEHNLMNGGTKKYPSEDISKIRDRLAHTNAITNLDRTTFPVEMLAEDLELYLDLISEVIFNPKFDEKMFEQQRQRVLREISEKRSDSAYQDMRDYRKALFLDHPAIYEGLGKESVIENATLEDVKRLYAKGYNAGNMQLYLVGKLPENIDELIAKYFADKPTGKSTKFEFPLMYKSDFKLGLYRPAPDLVNQAHPEESNCVLRVATVVPPAESEYYSALFLLNKILGVGSNSRVQKSISKKKGLAYNINSYYERNNNVGCIYVKGEVISLKQQEAINAVFEEFAKLRAEKVTEEELNNIKRKLVFGHAKSFGTNEGNLDYIVDYKKYGKTPSQMIEGYNAVTPEQIREAAQKFLPESRERGKYVMMVRDPLLK